METRLETGYPLKQSGSKTQRRREFLRNASLLAGLGHAGLLTGQTLDPSLITRERQPENLEFPFSSLDSFLTPNERFYVRNHFAAPVLESSAHLLKIGGTVKRPFEITLDELRKLGQSKVIATLECAGNSRALLTPQVGGVQWELGAVSTAEWTGVPLTKLLDRAGLSPDALEVVFEGADKGEPKNDPRPPGGTPYVRSIPLTKARRPEVLIAWAMNGKDLPQSHGAPVRAVVPGYYGMSSVKWLTGIQVINVPFGGYWQTTDYAYWDRSSGIPLRRPLWDMQVKSLIARPARRETLKANTSYQVTGAAWTGDADITKVELSSDGGKTWKEATIIDKAVRFAWRRWECEWQVPAETGRHVLMTRATDTRGNTQPTQHNRDMGNYGIHHTVPIEIQVS